MPPRKRKKPLSDGDHEQDLPTNHYQRMKSVQELEKDLRKLMGLHSSNSGDFATGGLLSELPVVPLINVFQKHQYPSDMEI